MIKLGSYFSSECLRKVKFRINNFLTESTPDEYKSSVGNRSGLDRVPLSKIPVRWARDEPDNHENGENCLMLLPDGTMADVNCSDIFPYICYKKNFKHAVLTGCGTYDDKYYLESKTGNCYKFHNTCQSWRRAYMTCVAEGGHLAIINSIEEADLLQKLYAKYAAAEIPCKYNHLVLLGFWDWNEDETWLTINGDTLEEAGFMKWANGSPDNKVSSKDQHCGAIYRTGSMTKMWCSVPAPFICEKAPDSLIASEYLLYK
ncbi:C-type mannose receptor 2-like [Aphomia sociella]